MEVVAEPADVVILAASPACHFAKPAPEQHRPAPKPARKGIVDWPRD
jgi:hypothetical protein